MRDEAQSPSDLNIPPIPGDVKPRWKFISTHGSGISLYRVGCHAFTPRKHPEKTARNRVGLGAEEDGDYGGRPGPAKTGHPGRIVVVLLVLLVLETPKNRPSTKTTRTRTRTMQAVCGPKRPSRPEETT